MSDKKTTLQLSQSSTIAQLTVKMLETVLGSDATESAQMQAMRSWADVVRLPATVELMQQPRGASTRQDIHIHTADDKPDSLWFCTEPDVFTLWTAVSKHLGKCTASEAIAFAVRRIDSINECAPPETTHE